MQLVQLMVQLMVAICEFSFSKMRCVSNTTACKFRLRLGSPLCQPKAPSTGAGAPGPLLAPDYATRLDAVLANAVAENDILTLPGVEVYAKRGGTVYHKAFGDMKQGSVFRMYSMTKVLTSTVALMLSEKGALSVDDAVGEYIPSFHRQWDIVAASKDEASAAGVVEYVDMVSGKNVTIPFTRSAAKRAMLISHLMSEHSGIGYEIFSDLDRKLGGVVGLGESFSIANALRQRVHPTVYRSGWHTCSIHATYMQHTCVHAYMHTAHAPDCLQVLMHPRPHPHPGAVL